MNNVNSFYEQHAQNNPPYSRPYDQLPSNLVDPSVPFDPRQILQPSAQLHPHPSQLQHRLADVSSRHHSPAIQQPSYHVNPLVPAKRNRPSDDAVNASPLPRPASLGVSRSQTPQQSAFLSPYAAQLAPSFQGSLPYQYLQNEASQHATPSPIVQKQHFTPQGQPHQIHRPQTNSPHQFAGQQLHPNNSALLQNNGNRLHALQNSAQQVYGFGHQNQGTSSANLSSTMSPIPGSLQPGMSVAADGYKQYQMQLQMQMAQQQHQLQGASPSNLEQLPQQQQQQHPQLQLQQQQQLPPQQQQLPPPQHPQSQPHPQHLQQQQQHQQQLEQHLQQQQQRQQQLQQEQQTQQKLQLQQHQQQHMQFQPQMHEQQQQQQQQQPYQHQQQPQHQNGHSQNTDADALGWLPRATVQHGNRAGSGNMQSQATTAGFTDAQQHQRQQFLASLQAFLQKNNQTLPSNPKICGRPVDYFKIFLALAKLGIIVAGPQRGNWTLLATSLNFPPDIYPTAAEEVKQMAEQYIQSYAMTWFASMAKRKQMMAQQHHQQHQHGPTPGQSQQAPQGSPQSGPPRKAPSMLYNQLNTPQLGVETIPVTGGPGSDTNNSGTSIPTPNLSARISSPAPNPKLQQSQQQPFQPSLPQTVDVANQSGMVDKLPPLQRRTSANQARHATPVRTPQIKSAPSMTPPQFTPERLEKGQLSSPAGTVDAKLNVVRMAETPQDLAEPQPFLSQTLKTYGGIDLRRMSEMGLQLARLKAAMPAHDHRGCIDVHTLIKSVQSGLHNLVESALDHLMALSRERLQLTLDDCEDLMDALLDCAEEQLAILTQRAEGSRASACLDSYNHVQRECRLELETLGETPLFASMEYECHHAADRILSIMTILCNLSFFESNQDVLAGANVVTFVGDLIRNLASRRTFMQSSRNTLELMKDIVTFLSNTAEKITFSQKEDALSFLHFLVAFTPERIPLESDDGTFRVAQYVPTLHHYLPCAVDSLAKLLARDDPNRAYYKSIFLSSAASTPPYELLSKAFALAVAAVPSRGNDNLSNAAILAVCEARKPFLSQGMLAADILASMVPNAECGLARSWLECEDGWAPNFLHVVVTLASQENPALPRGPPNGHNPMQFGEGSFEMITHHGLSTLRKLSQKMEAQDGELPFQLATFTTLDNILLGALMNMHFDKQALDQVVAITRLVD